MHDVHRSESSDVSLDEALAALRTVLDALERVVPFLDRCLTTASDGRCTRAWMVSRRRIGMSPQLFRCDEHGPGPKDDRREWADAPWAPGLRAAAKIRARFGL